MEAESKKAGMGAAFLMAAAYFTSYVTRINFGAVIAEMVRQTGFEKTQLSLAITGSFIAYGLGQLISGFLGDRIQPRLMVFFGLLVSSAMNALVPVCAETAQMVWVWCVNGFAQSLLWPPIVRLLAGLYENERYQKATVIVSWGSSLGTVALYLISPAVISLWDWRFVFWGTGACALVMAAVWLLLCPTVPPANRQIQKGGGGKKPLSFVWVWGAMAAIVLHGMLRDGVATWMPTYIDETFHLGSALSILTGVILPVFSLICIQLTALLYRKALPDPLLCGGALFALGAAAALALAFLSDSSAAVSVGLSALLTASMHGVNLILICMLPAFFQRYGNVSFMSGVLNACTYAGSALSTYGIAALADGMGWRGTIALWPVIAGAGMLICLACVPLRKKAQIKE